MWQSVFGPHCPISAVQDSERVVILHKLDAAEHKTRLEIKKPDDPAVRKEALGFRWEDVPSYVIPNRDADLRQALTRWLYSQTKNLPFYHRAFWGWTFKVVPIVAGGERWGAIHASDGSVCLCKGGRWLFYKDADYDGPVFVCEKEFVDHGNLYGTRLQRLAEWLTKLREKA